MKTTMALISWLLLTTMPVFGMSLVGESKLQVLFWDIYTARLYSPSGQFTDIRPPLTLSLTYHRNIKASALMDATREQWQRMNYVDPDSLFWLKQVSDCFPDVGVGDNLTFRLLSGNDAHIEFNGEVRCSLPPSKGNRQFLAIWLSEESAYPRFTQRLIAKGD